MPSSSRAVPKPRASSARRCSARRSSPANAISRPSSSWFGLARPRVKRSMPRCSKHPGRHNGANGDIIVAMKRAKPADKPLRGLSGRLVLLGAGKMGSAMLEGWLARGFDPRKLVVVEPHPTKAIKALARRDDQSPQRNFRSKRGCDRGEAAERAGSDAGDRTIRRPLDARAFDHGGP